MAAAGGVDAKLMRSSASTASASERIGMGRSRGIFRDLQRQIRRQLQLRIDHRVQHLIRDHLHHGAHQRRCALRQHVEDDA